MKTKFNGTEFNKFLNMTKKAPKKPSLLILRNIAFFEDRAEVTNFDNYLTLNGEKIEGREKEGAYLVNYSDLQKLQKNFEKAEAVTVYNKEDRFYIDVDNKNIYSCPLMDDDNSFPPVPSYEDFTESGKDFFKEVFPASICASGDSTRMSLNGVFYAGPGCYASTDGHWMKAGKTLEHEGHGVIISRVFLDFVKLGKFDLENKTVFYNDFVTVFKAENIKLVSKNLEGPYPNYKAVIPTEFEKGFKVKKLDLVEALKALNPFTRETTHGFLMVPVNGFLCMYADDEGRGVEKSVKIDAEGIKLEGPKGRMAFDAGLLLKLLDLVKADSLEFKYNGELNATLVEGDEAINLIMPLCQRVGRGEEESRIYPESLDPENCEYMKAEEKTVKKAVKKSQTVKAEAVDVEKLKAEAMDRIRTEVEAEKAKMMEAARVEVEAAKKSMMETAEAELEKLKKEYIEKGKKALMEAANKDVENYKKELVEKVKFEAAKYNSELLSAYRAEAQKEYGKILKKKKEAAEEEVKDFKSRAMEAARSEACSYMERLKDEGAEVIKKDLENMKAEGLKAVEAEVLEHREAVEKQKAEEASRREHDDLWEATEKTILDCMMDFEGLEPEKPKAIQVWKPRPSIFRKVFETVKEKASMAAVFIAAVLLTDAWENFTGK